MKILFSLILWIAIIPVTAKQMNTSEQKPGKKILRYSDGSGNVYELRNDSIFYKPITDPMKSSSGTYTGGAPTSKALQPGAYKTTEKMFEKLIRNKSIHIKDRVMGSGFLQMNDGKRDMDAIIRNDPEKDALEKQLKSLI